MHVGILISLIILFLPDHLFGLLQLLVSLLSQVLQREILAPERLYFGLGLTQLLPQLLIQSLFAPQVGKGLGLHLLDSHSVLLLHLLDELPQLFFLVIVDLRLKLLHLLPHLVQFQALGRISLLLLSHSDHHRLLL